MELQEVHYPLPGLLPTKTVIQTLAAKILTYSLPLTMPSADGIDVISISLGQENALDITIDSLSIGSLHAMERGVLTVHSAGNTGLSTVRASVTSVAPWLLSVAASIIDCRIINRVVLGGWKDSATCMYLQRGNAVNGFHLNGSEFSLVQGMEVTGTCDEYNPGLYEVGCLDSSKVKGKMVLCNDVGDHSRELTLEDPLSIELVPLDLLIPQANILKRESLHDSAAPIVASFSSKGPNIIISGILKVHAVNSPASFSFSHTVYSSDKINVLQPDITALGIDILAAYSPVASPTDDLPDKKSVKFSVLSGTSISCPHVAGVAAYLTSLHPDWSPSAIKSTLMTTTRPMNAKKNPAAEFGYGAGHLDPVNSANPGLVYETFKDNYIKMSCSMGYNSSKLRKMLGDNSNCPEGPKGSPKELNYPSMTVQVEAKKPFTAKFPRTVTNVGFKNSTYKAEISKDDLVNVSVEPRILSFNSLNEKKSFVVTISGEGLDDSKSVSASLVWSDGTHRVQSPIVIYTSMYFNA
ncbi:hypothetical protein HYC85_023308 [Camellia sinensis]|uniref:Subtilisin-like protease fibronectin type-III domain-containing protein n=1 Tax=Camellia sinensis TaxID=4442 RepID=A0A7J7GE79_CAMSI|nr:hypothetical protein HYC85_023308 [Camellia sinensis]